MLYQPVLHDSAIACMCAWLMTSLLESKEINLNPPQILMEGDECFLDEMSLLFIQDIEDVFIA